MKKRLCGSCSLDPADSVVICGRLAGHGAPHPYETWWTHTDGHTCWSEAPSNVMSVGEWDDDDGWFLPKMPDDLVDKSDPEYRRLLEFKRAELHVPTKAEYLEHKARQRRFEAWWDATHGAEAE